MTERFHIYMIIVLTFLLVVSPYGPSFLALPLFAWLYILFEKVFEEEE